MANHVIVKSAPIGVLPSCLGELRQHVLAALLCNPHFSKAEQLRANHFVHETEDVARLTRWHANVLVEITRREAAAAHQRGRTTLQTTLRQLSPGNFRSHRPRKIRLAPTWIPRALLSNHMDRWAGTFDRLAAAHFQPTDALTLADLLNCPRR